MKRSRICLALFLLSLCAPAFGNPEVELSIWTNCSQIVSAHGETCPAKQFPSTTCSLPVAEIDLSFFSPGCTVGADNDGAVRKFRGKWEVKGILRDKMTGNTTEVVLPLGRFNTRRKGDDSVNLPSESDFLLQVAHLPGFWTLISMDTIATPKKKKPIQAYALDCEAHGPPAEICRGRCEGLAVR